MDTPQRLLDGTGSALEQALVQELRSYRGPDKMRAHTLAALGAAGSTGLAAGSALAWWAGKTWSTKLLLTVSVTSVLLGVPAGYFILRQSSTPLAPPAPLTVATSLPVEPLPEPATPTAPPVLDAPASPTPPTVARLSKSGATTSANLRAELTALDAVRSTLASGNFLAALSLLESYFRNFHHGRLQLEAEILRIDALARSGQTDAARTYAKEFLRRHPKSVHAARLQSIVEP